MIKKLLSVALIAVAVSANAQQLKVRKIATSNIASTQRSGFSSVAAVSNLGFETWSGGAPTGWSTINVIAPGSCTQYTTSPGTGTSSALMTTVSCTACPGYGLPNKVGAIEQFTNYVGQPVSLSFQYKCAILAGDTGSIFAGLQVAGAATGQAYMLFSGTVSTWTTQTVNFMYSNAVNSDTINLLITSSDSGFITGHGIGRPALGSKLYMDAIAVNTASGIQTIFTYNDYVMFPNPASAELNFVIKDTKAKKVEVYDISGRMINSFTIENERTQISSDKMTNGMYFYRVMDANGGIIHTDKFNVTK